MLPEQMLSPVFRPADNETGPAFADAMPSETPARYGYESSPGGINARNVHRATRHSLPADQDPHRTMWKVCVWLPRHTAASGRDASTVIGIDLLGDAANGPRAMTCVHCRMTQIWTT